MKRSLLLAVALLALTLGVAAPAPGAPPDYEHLDPGGQPTLAEQVPVNVVLVGFPRNEAAERAYRAGLPRTSQPVVRSRLPYGIVEKLGIDYRYAFRMFHTGRAYEDRFFGTLSRLARPARRTDAQQAYNAQRGNRLDVTANHHIDAPTVERWLAEHPPTGVDTSRNTVFLVNWWGRDDFRFHVYTKTNEPDPDTGYNFGKERDSRKVVAWGGTTARDEEDGLGTTRRVWFHDVSAGPETWSGSFNVDDVDLDGDGEADYRIPPVWEYGAYRPLSALPRDLALVTRYVAVDLLFTSSPLYPVELPTTELPRSIDIDSNTYEGWSGVDASRSYLTPPLIRSELAELMPENRVSYDNQDLPFSGAAQRCYEAFVQDVSCYPDEGYPAYANLFLQNNKQLARTKDDGDAVDYELPIFNYALDDETAPALGFADDNYVNGTQSFVFSFVSPGIVEAGYGLSTTMIHEVGHHIGLSHPHDGYDSESGEAFGPTGDRFFAWLGDESNSMMSYIDLNWDFSQFDHDNLDRFRTAALVEAANRLAGEAINDSPRPNAAADELRRADAAIGRAEAAFAGHDYRGAMAQAVQAYEQTVVGARQAGIDVRRSAMAARRVAGADRRAGEVHDPGEFIDTLEEGPRGAP